MTGVRMRLAPRRTDLTDTQKHAPRHLGPPVPVEERVDALAPGEACLLVQERAGAGFVLRKDAVVGRHPSSDLLLNDITVSRRHAELRRFGDIYQITDLGSLNGTYVNGDRIEDAVLTPGDEVQIGRFRFIFLANR